MHVRFRNLPALQEHCSPMTDAILGEIKNQIRHLLNSNPTCVKEDISDLDTQEVRSLLLSKRKGVEEVFMVWPSERYGARTNYGTFVKHYDDLWYPSMDDLWVTNTTVDWVIELNHEETLTLCEHST
jgi:hypothetical protein